LDSHPHPPEFSDLVFENLSCENRLDSYAHPPAVYWPESFPTVSALMLKSFNNLARKTL